MKHFLEEIFRESLNSGVSDENITILTLLLQLPACNRLDVLRITSNAGLTWIQGVGEGVHKGII